MFRSKDVAFVISVKNLKNIAKLNIFRAEDLTKNPGWVSFSMIYVWYHVKKVPLEV